MSGNIQNKLADLEITPPPIAWENINARLDEEFDSNELKLSEKLYNWETPPPPIIWDKIIGDLDAETIKKKPAKILPFTLKRAAIAAIIFGIIVIPSLYFLFNTAEADSTELNIKPNKADEIAGLRSTKDSSVTNKNNQPLPENPTLVQSDANQQVAAVSTASTLNRNTKKRPNRKRSSVNYADITAAPFISSNNISVTAPPIRDEHGNIIQDINLITTPDHNYIIVTSPNGEQTRISIKFLPMLTDMNTARAADYTEDAAWKERFNEWRNKIMNKSSFIPTASNFLDIMELKALIEDKR